MFGVKAVNSSTSLPVEDKEVAILQRHRQQTEQQDRLEKAVEKKEEEKASSGMIAQIGTTIWQWITYPYAGSGIIPDTEESQVDAIAPSAPIPAPVPIDNREFDLALAELKQDFNKLQTIDQEVTKGSSIEKEIYAQFGRQNDLYQAGILEERRNFATNRLTKKSEEKQFQEISKKYDEIGQESKWWVNVNSVAEKVSFVAALVYSVYSFGTAQVGEGISSLAKAGLTTWTLLNGVRSAIYGFAKGHFEYKSSMTELEVTKQRRNIRRAEVKLTENTEFLGNLWAKFHVTFDAWLKIVQKKNEAIRS